ncbi:MULTISPECIES: NAD(P)H-binding protein [Frankia]|uniref:NAD(P)H-binding protein n=1 Tax=Frankia TaxID=1854 RepID=UPI000310C81E|nr:MULTISPECIES: NAD(P)H-binding protein [Frankia]
MTILVTGGRGSVARALIDELLAVDAPVRVVSRDPAQADVPAGVQVAAADLARPESIPAVLDGVRAVFLYAEPAGIDGFLDAAAAAKVERIVLLSSQSAQEPDRSNPIAHRHVVVEEAIAASGLAWTFVRPGAFATNALAWAPSIRAQGVVRGAYPESHSAPIHERDMAEVAARALLEPGHEGQRYALTGPESLPARGQVEVIGEVIGRPLRFEAVPLDEAREQLLAQMGPSAWPGIADTLLRYQADSDGRPVAVSDTVAAVTGRPARTFATWVADHASAFRPER